MSVYVVDASVAAKWFFEESYSDDALRLLNAKYQLHAPDFLLLELDSIICGKIRRTEISEDEAYEVRSAVRSFPLEKHPFALLMDAAFELSCRSQGSVYDCMYLVLAMLVGGRMVTADRRFYNALSTIPFLDHLCWVADLP
jgi:predicted nucleic acid-binding protein